MQQRRRVVSRGKLGRASCVLLLAAGGVHCGETRSNPISAAVAGAPSAGGEYEQGGEGGEVASTNASGAGGAAGSGFEAAGAPTGGLGGMGLGGEGGEAGEAGKPLECDANAVRLLSVFYSQGVFGATADLVLLEYDAAGRLENVNVGADANSAYYPFTYSYDDQGRIESFGSNQTDGAGYSLTYESDRIRYTSDDMLPRPSVEFSGKRWVGTLGGTTIVPTWSNGLITAITTDSTGGAFDALQTFTYELDGLGYPTRLIPSVDPAPLTEEVYDANGHHLFQLVRTDGGELSGVRLYRDNTDPVRSLLQSVCPGEAGGNLWLGAGFDPAAEGYVVGNEWPRPLDLVPWRPLSLSAEEASDFSVDVDGDGSVDVAGDYELDAQARLTSFVLKLAGVPRVVLSLKYTPSLVTEAITYPGSKQPDDLRRYSYGCIDLSP